MLRIVFKVTIAGGALLFAALLIGAFGIKPVTYKQNHGGGWTVALVQLDTDETVLDVFRKVEEGKLIWVDKKWVISEDSVDFLADPFLVRSNDSTFLFVETQVADRGAYITVFYVPDSFETPVYMGVALKEPFHLSYPQIVKINEKYFMIPESQSGDSSYVYICESMPLGWKRAGIIYPGRIKDPTLLPISDSTGYLYYGLKGKLFKQDYIFANQKFELSPPIYLKTGTCFRPGGKPVEINGKNCLLLQDNSCGYGTALYAFPLSKDGMQDKQAKAYQLLRRSEFHSPFQAGMHHLCALRLKSGKMLVAVDGNHIEKKGTYFSMKFFVKYAYLKLWDSIFRDQVQPWYPFNE
jgi:hypothetical protein